MSYLDKQFWNPPTDLISKVYDCKYGRKKKKNGKKPINKRKVEFKKLRNFYIKYFGLHDSISTASICHLIAEKLNIPEPLQNNQQHGFMKKSHKYFCRQYKKSKIYISKYKTPSEFYASKEWKELRYIALKKANGCCQLCGSRANEHIKLHVDHIKPRSIFPQFELDLNNLQVLCSDCNIGKSNIDTTDWR